MSIDEDDISTYQDENNQLLKLKQQFLNAKHASSTLDAEVHRSLEALNMTKRECLKRQENEILPLERMICDIVESRDQLSKKKLDLEVTLMSIREKGKAEVQKTLDETKAQITFAERKIDLIVTNKRKTLKEKKELVSNLISESQQYDMRIRSLKQGLLC